MAKPTHQWETPAHRATRLEREALPSALSDDPRAEAFELGFDDGPKRAALGLAQQFVELEAWREDEQLEAAIVAWLVARGARTLKLHALDGTPLAERAISAAELSAPGGGDPQRIVTLCPSAAELVHALGVFDRVIACEDSSDYPPQVEQLERLGPDLGPDLDRVAELSPDLVVSSLTVPGMERVVSGLRARGIAQYVSAPRGLEDVRREMVEFGERLGVAEAGLAARAAFDAEREALMAQRPSTPTRVFLEWWPRPIFAPGRDCYSNELIELAGGVNVCGERPGSSLEISAEEVVEAAPELYFVSWCGVAADKLDPERVIRREGFEELAVAQRRAVYPVDEAFAGRPGPRMLEAARIMQRAIAKERERGK